ncbi:bifunctional ornithine acetyltransferase/N-acetylglutamate synthase [bacterium Unc6]|nr:bifunctional ornithine acetyltransferase/N-acetylglutamate synthase [bacterium Unc6]
MKGITKPKGFFSSGISSGIKKKEKLDLALIYSEVPFFVSGVFTKNSFKAAPVLYCMGIVKKGTAQAVIINSGNANCATVDGDKDVVRMAEYVAGSLLISKKDVLVCSTGVIGRKIHLKKIERAVPELVSSISKKGSNAALAIITTDKVPKEVERSFKIGSRVINIGGMAKGSGMIAPDMAMPSATLLAFITTDVNIGLSALRKATQYAVDCSFNRISVDGSMSTNDTVLVMANGLAGNKRMDEGKDFETFKRELTLAMQELSKKIVKDGEGATKIIKIWVKGAYSEKDAYLVAKNVANSNLVKTAVYGSDPNWGRIISAVGSSTSKVDPKRLSLWIDKIQVFKDGAPANFKITDVRKEFKKKNISVYIDLGIGNYSDFFWTCDLTEEYIRINSSYTT